MNPAVVRVELAHWGGARGFLPLRIGELVEGSNPPGLRATFTGRMPALRPWDATLEIQ